MAFAENPVHFFVDLGVDGVLDGAAVRGIFDNGYTQALGGIASLEASYMLASTAAAAATQASVLVIAGTTYRVRSLEPDGTGVTVLRLERQ